MKNILCYGDSNTFGTDPVHGGRHPGDVRWTGLLGRLLGPEYNVIEEGCGGRTTVFNDEISYGRNGLRMLVPCIASHNPLDLIIIMLGTNDLKHRFQVTAWDLGKAMGQVVDTVLAFPFEPVYQRPRILVVSPVHIKDGIENSIYGCFTRDSVGMSHAFAAEYGQVCREKGCHFFDAAQVAQASNEDKLHMDAGNHRKLAEALEAEVRRILESGRV